MTTTSAAVSEHGSALMKTLNAAISRTMNDFGTTFGCRPMHWYLPEFYSFDRGDLIGFPSPISDHDREEGVRIAEFWASLLALVERVDETPGFRCWIGRAGNSKIEIWCRATTGEQS